MSSRPPHQPQGRLDELRGRESFPEKVLARVAPPAHLASGWLVSCRSGDAESTGPVRQ